MRVRCPHYPHVLDRVQGAAHFMVTDEEARQIMREPLTLVSGIWPGSWRANWRRVSARRRWTLQPPRQHSRSATLTCPTGRRSEPVNQFGQFVDRPFIWLAVGMKWTAPCVTAHAVNHVTAHCRTGYAGHLPHCVSSPSSRHAVPTSSYFAHRLPCLTAEHSLPLISPQSERLGPLPTAHCWSYNPPAAMLPLQSPAQTLRVCYSSFSIS